MTYLDGHPDVLQWASEEIVVPYRSPLDGRIHRYFPDFWVRKRTTNGNVETVLIEVKPLKETMEPKPQTRITKRYLREVATWGVNQAKWKAAEEYCKDRNWNFIKMTEQELGIK